jgi:hypothetical protein
MEKVMVDNPYLPVLLSTDCLQVVPGAFGDALELKKKANDKVLTHE